MKKFLIITLILDIISAYCIFIGVKSNIKKLEYEPLTYAVEEYKEYVREQCFSYNGEIPGRKQVEKMIEKEFGLGVVIVRHDLKRADAWGETYMYVRTINMDKEISKYDDEILYAFVFAHECCHLDKITNDERYTQFETFKTLIRSNNKYLKSIGYYSAYYVLSYCVGDDYDCRQQVIEYLRKERV